MNRARKGCGVIACILLAFSVLLATPSWASAASVDVQRILDTSRLGDPFVFDVDPAGAVLVLTRDNIFDAGAKEFLFGEPLKNPGWLAFAGVKLQFLANGALFVVDGRIPRKLLDVPLKSRVFASDGERTYIGGITETGRALLFLYKEGMGHKALLELDAPVDAMVLARGKLFFSVGPRIYVLGEGGPAKLFAHLPGFSRIPSIAVDDKSGLLYFSDGDNLYAVHGGDFVLVRRGVGGMLRCREGDLYILSWRDHILFRMRGLSEVFSTAGTLVPLEDPCKAPVLSLYCGAEEKRAVLKSLAALEGSIAPGDAAAGNELGAYMAGQKKEYERIMAALEKEAVAGANGVLWGGGAEPKTVGANAAIATERIGVGVALWDGSDIRVGPDSKVVVGDRGPSRECRQTLEKGLLYFEAGKPPVEGMVGPAPRPFVIDTEALNLVFGSARLAVFASGDRTAVVVLEGRVKAGTRRGESVIVAAGETLEARRGEPSGTPRQAEIGRLNRWWEKIR